MNELNVPAVGALDAEAMGEARAHQAQLTKPPGSLGRLEELAVWLAGVQGAAHPVVSERAVLVAAADHGVTAEGVSVYPPEVTAQMVQNFLAGGAAVNALARQCGASVVVADFGVAGEPPAVEGLVRCSLGPGTRNFAREPAMTRAEAVKAVERGAAIVREQLAGTDLLALGEMGIGNTTSASAITAAFTGAAPEAVTGRGTGVDDDGWQRKVAVVSGALALHDTDALDPIGVLSAMGGFEIGGLAGAIIGAAAQRTAVILDGFITGAAALVAVALEPAVLPFMVASHRSVEPGQTVVLDALGLRPLLELQMRLGEGTGAILAMQLIAAAVAAHNEMATFAGAGVAGRG